jgi:hypothetical protein
MLLTLIIWIGFAFLVITWAESAESRFRRVAGLSDIPHKFSPTRFGWSPISTRDLGNPIPEPMIEAARIQALKRSKAKYKLCVAALAPAALIAYLSLTALSLPFDDRLLYSPWAVAGVMAVVWLAGLAEGTMQERIRVAVIGLIAIGIAVMRAVTS